MNFSKTFGFWNNFKIKELKSSAKDDKNNYFYHVLDTLFENYNKKENLNILKLK